MTQQLMLLITLGLAYSSYSGGIAAQKFHFPDPNAAPTAAEASQGPFIPSPELHNPNDPSTGASAGLPSSAPIVVLPVPLPGGGLPGLIIPMDCNTLAVTCLETRHCTGSMDISYVILRNPLLEEIPVQLQSQPAYPLHNVWSRSLQHDPSLLPLIRNPVPSTPLMVKSRRTMVPLQEVRVDVTILNYKQQ